MEINAIHKPGGIQYFPVFSIVLGKNAFARICNNPAQLQPVSLLLTVTN